jgi:hypothetical protein
MSAITNCVGIRLPWTPINVSELLKGFCPSGPFPIFVAFERISSRSPIAKVI